MIQKSSSLARGAPSASPTTDPKTVAAVDLGSNSFHMIVARSDGGPLEVLDRMRERVQIAAGLDDEGYLSDEAQSRAFGCLERFGQRLRDIPSDCVRAVGTNTFRRAENGRQFRQQAEIVLGHTIEIIGGGEEARLVHLGVSRQQSLPEGRHLFIDVGGGSTELIVAEGDEILATESLPFGCVSHTLDFFGRGRLSEKAFQKAVIAARRELLPIEKQFRDYGITHSFGSAGTAHAVQRLVRETGDPHELVTRAGVRRLRDELFEAGTIDALELPGLSEDRRPVIAGGIAIYFALFKAFKLDQVSAVPGGVREGILHDLIGRISDVDTREITLERSLERFSVDRGQAERVQQTALHLFDAIAKKWGMPEEARWRLSAAARLHEIGLSISHHGYHKHGEYLILNADLPGFSTDEKEVLATLVRYHRRSVSRKRFNALPHCPPAEALRLCALLRIAVVLHRTRSESGETAVKAKQRGKTLELCFPPNFFASHPLTRAELAEEVDRAQRWELPITAVEVGGDDGATRLLGS